MIFKKYYTLKNIIYKHELRKYVNWIIHNSKSADFSAYNQLITIRDDIAVKLQQSILIIMKNTYVSDILNVINDAKMDWWALGVKFTWNSNKDCQHSEQPNQEPADRKNQVIPDCQSSHSYPTYSLNFNTGNYRFLMNLFNLMFFIILHLMNFPFIYFQNP